MRPLSDYAPPDAPIDLPDDIGIEETRVDIRAASWAAVLLVLTLGIAVLVIWGAFA